MCVERCNELMIPMNSQTRTECFLVGFTLSVVKVNAVNQIIEGRRNRGNGGVGGN